MTEGQALATVSQSSVMNAIVSAQETLDGLDDSIESALKDSVGYAITTAVPGRVKKLYASPGERVTDVMTRDGARRCCRWTALWL